MDNRQILSEVVVQILGFGIIFFILKQLAWNKLMGVIDARRKTIEGTFSDLESRARGLEDLEKEYRLRLENIEKEARAKIQEAAGQGLLLSKDIQDKARHDAEKLVDRARAEIEQDVAKAKLAMRDEIVEISSLLAEKIIREKLDAKQHQRLVDQFIRDLEKVRG